MLRIVLADDHPMFREALRMLLESTDRYEVVGQTGEGTEVLQLVEQLRPDIVCLDIQMPGQNGIESARQLRTIAPQLRILAVSTYADREYVSAMLAAGALGYVTKTESGSELLRAMDSVAQGRAYLCPDATDALRDPIAPRGPAPLARLAPREMEVLRLVTAGRTSAEIASQLGIAPGTVEVHRRNIMRKLDVSSAVELTRVALRTGLVSGE